MLYIKHFRHQILDEYRMSNISIYWMFLPIAPETVNFQMASCFERIFRRIPTRGEVMMEEIKTFLEAGGV